MFCKELVQVLPEIHNQILETFSTFRPLCDNQGANNFIEAHLWNRQMIHDALLESYKVMNCFFLSHSHY